MKILDWLRDDSSSYMSYEKCLICSWMVLTEKSLANVEWDLKRV
jgi:hypothetical protein